MSPAFACVFLGHNPDANKQYDHFHERELIRQELYKAAGKKCKAKKPKWMGQAPTGAGGACGVPQRIASGEALCFLGRCGSSYGVGENHVYELFNLRIFEILSSSLNMRCT